MAFIVLLLPCGPAIGQAGWTQRSPAASPPPRHSHAMAYDQARHRVVLFGGFGSAAGCGIYADTWEWDGTTWTERFPANSPPARAWHAMAWCAARSRVVLFGGAKCSSVLSDTWEWDGNNWLQIAPSAAPPARFASAMAQDAGGNVLLFGGASWKAETYFSDTWEWSGQWVQRAPATSPAPRDFPTMTLDARRGRVVLFGGAYRSAVYLDTWEWDGTTWTERQPAFSPPRSRSGPFGTYDGERDRVVLLSSTNFVTLDTWEWDGGGWTQRPPASSLPWRNLSAMTHDWLRGEVVTFGGNDPRAAQTAETWVYSTPSPATYSLFGAGCPGSAGTPGLGVGSPFERPWIGSGFSLAVGSLPPGSATVVSLGASNTRWGAARLPFDLTGLGAPGCTLYASAEAVLPVTNVAGTATLTLAIPNVPGLGGLAFYNQAFVADAAANPLGATVSNGGAAVVGVR